MGLGNSSTFALKLGDVDGDGDLDAFAANYNQGHRVWLGVGGNRAPTLDALTNVTLNEDDPQQTVNLAGISAGSGETQSLKVTAALANVQSAALYLMSSSGVSIRLPSAARLCIAASSTPVVNSVRSTGYEGFPE